jgi:hypothetical protein
VNGTRWIHPGQNRGRSIPIFPRTLVAGALSLIALSPTVGLAASNHVACAVPFIVGTQTCYSPSQEQVAGHRATWAMSPNQAVHLTFGLPLSQVSVERLSRNDTEIDYMYGPLRYDYGRQGKSPIAVRVMEFSAPMPQTGRSRTQTEIVASGGRKSTPPWVSNVVVCGQHMQISPAADPSRAHPAYGPWSLVSNFPSGRHAFGIVANSARKMIETVACRLIGRAG